MLYKRLLSFSAVIIGCITALNCGGAEKWGYAEGGKPDLKNVQTLVFEIAGKNKQSLAGPFNCNGDKKMDITCLEQNSASTCYEFTFKFAPEDGKTSSVMLYTGNGKQFISLNILEGKDTINWLLSNENGDKPERQRFYNISYRFCGEFKKDFSLNDSLIQWSEYIQSLQPDIRDRTFRLVIMMEKNTCEAYLDGMFLGAWKPDTQFFQSKMRLALSQGVTLLPVKKRILRQGNPLFRTVDISNRLNAGDISGKKINPESLPLPGKQVIVDKIPFILPEPAIDGKNNIDIGKSWFRNGLLSGMHAPDRGVFGGRWGGVFAGDPLRIQFRIPFKMYDAVYLLATSDGEKNTVPRVTLQFYRPCSGFPKNFISPDIPLFAVSSEGASCVPVKTSDGKDGGLYLIKIPVNPAALKEFSDLDYLEMEITKEVKPFRNYPDPLYFSSHGAGLPSSVHVFALTMGLPAVELDFNPDNYANIWTESEKPSYTAKLKNLSEQERSMTLCLRTNDWGNKEKHEISKAVTIPANSETAVKFQLPLERYGWHQIKLEYEIDGRKYDFERTCAFLRNDERPHSRPFSGDGFVFGFWNWRGDHITPGSLEAFKIMGMAGAGSMHSSIYESWGNEEVQSVLRKYGMRNYQKFSRSPYTMGFQGSLEKKYFPDNPEKSIESLMKELEQGSQRVSDISEPVLVTVFPEPSLGPTTYGSLPQYFGESELKLTQNEEKRFQDFKEKARISVKAVKEKFPGIKILLPWGAPEFCIAFIKEKDELAAMIDGAGFDTGYFERLPEQQFHQCSLHRLWQFCQEWKKYKDTKPVIVSVEGPCISPVMEGALNEKQFSEHITRSSMLLAAYGLSRQLSTASPFDCASPWGEQHYGSGLVSRINTLNPHVAYCSFATMAQRLREMDYAGFVPTGSISTYCLNFRDVNTGAPMYVLWTVRGKRSVAFKLKTDGKVIVSDSMDNEEMIKSVDGIVTINIDTSPVYVYGIGEKPEITLGKPDHSDSQLGKHNILLGNSGELKWRQVEETDTDYTDNNPDFIRRFPGKMQVKNISSKELDSKSVLSIHLDKQEKDRGNMPFYTTLYLDKPLAIPGKASMISIWVKAASDWGRVIYILKDAKGEKFISVGSKGEWNCDDTHGWSSFNFDGWRLLRFELPSNSPYDLYRENGSTWWGHSGGDGIVDLPLKLEKIIVERRPKAMYVTSLEDTDGADVLLGEIYAEYENNYDMTEKAVELSRVRMNPPEGKWKAPNPVADLEAKGVLPQTEMIAVNQPPYVNNGKHGIFEFKEIESAKSYDIYVGLKPDGEGALLLGKDIKKSNAKIRGFHPNADFYAFVVYKDNQDRNSKPSKPFKFNMKDMLSQK
jgi:hypothetical protein